MSAIVTARPWRGPGMLVAIGALVLGTGLMLGPTPSADASEALEDIDGFRTLYVVSNDNGSAGIEQLPEDLPTHKGQMALLALTKTYAIRMAAVFMISLATIWLKTGLMQRWLVFTTYGSAIGLLLSSDLSMWIALVFPAWVLLVSVLALVRSGVIDLRHDDPPR